MDSQTVAQVQRRAFWRCEYCHLRQSITEFKLHIEHVIPRQHGGGDSLDNLALACGFCNRHKGSNLAGIDRASSSMVRLFNPRKDRWNDHFKLSGTHLIGLTDIGRTTVAVLAMNHPWQRWNRRRGID